MPNLDESKDTRFHLRRRTLVTGAACALGLLIKPVAATERALASSAEACGVPSPTAKVVITGLNFPENPRWHQGALWFADIHAHKVFRAAPGGQAEVVAALDDRVSGLGFLPDGTLLAVSLLDRKLWAITADGPAGAKVRVHADVSHLSGNFINDMVVDATGRAYVGSRNGGPPESASDSLILVTPDGRARVAAENMVSPNGSVVTPDGGHLIVAETALGRLTRFAIGPNGALSDRATLAHFPGHHIDGLCRDGTGTFWGGGAAEGLLRITADGKALKVIPFPGRMVIACAVGGARRRTLYLTTTSPKLLDNLKHIANDRSRDAAVNSDGRIETLDLDSIGC